ncbi:MAG: formylglycine-generating enzyme family protein [Anaerolinea sp.]|nr:formylglycine-generating enzyme family protein [Anaerolinea sp.]
MLRRIILIVGWIIALISVSISSVVAQRDDPANSFEIVIYADQNSLNVLFPGNIPVSLKGLQFQVEINREKRAYSLDWPPAFRGLFEEPLGTPACLRYLRLSARNQWPYPTLCLENVDRNHRYTAEVDDSGVFWWDSDAAQGVVVRLLRDGVPIPNAVCPAGIPEQGCKLVIPHPPIPTSRPTLILQTRVPSGTSTPTPPSVAGSSDISIAASPFTDSYGDANGAFTIGTFEVTNQEFVEFLNRSGDISLEGKLRYSESANRRRIYSSNLIWIAEAGFELHPVTGVSWYGARDYCDFIGGRLPTFTELHKAALWQPANGSAFPYPWGNELPASDRVNLSDFVRDTTPVGSYPLGKSTLGVYDSFGNVWEWTTNRAGVNALLFGGAWDTNLRQYGPVPEARTTTESVAPNIGIRCAR